MTDIIDHDLMNPSQGFSITAVSRPMTTVALALMAITGTACNGSLADLGATDEPEASAADQEEAPLRDAEQALANHRIDEARQHYGAYLERYPEHGAAAAGVAITNILLLLEIDEIRHLLTDHLGAAHGLDANTILYDKGGYLYWASRGVRWQDDGEYRGIASLLEEHLPWPVERLTSLTTFVDGLAEPTDQMIRQLVWLANALPSIDRHLAIAIDDPNFQRLYIPGEVFHSSALSLQLGRSELSLIRALLSAARGLIYFVAAYDHPWSLEMAFGPWRYTPDITHPYYDPSYEPIDYMVLYFDDHLFRNIANPDRLQAARSAFEKALEYGRHAVTFGVEERSSTTLHWDGVDEGQARDLDDFLAALAEAFEEPTTIPHTDPGVTVDLRPLFQQGRHLAKEIPWVEPAIAPASADEPLSLSERWAISDQARRAFFFDGVVEPIPTDLHVTLNFGPDNDPANFVDVLVGHYRDRIDDVYNTTR